MWYAGHGPLILGFLILVWRLDCRYPRIASQEPRDPGPPCSPREARQAQRVLFQLTSLGSNDRSASGRLDMPEPCVHQVFLDIDLMARVKYREGGSVETTINPAASCIECAFEMWCIEFEIQDRMEACRPIGHSALHTVEALAGWRRPPAQHGGGRKLTSARPRQRTDRTVYMHSKVRSMPCQERIF
jgi:hypothetical protein